MKYNIALVGLAVMGENLARNIASRGFKVAVYNRHHEVADAFVEKYGTESFTTAHSYEEIIEKLEKPRKIILMIKAGNPVDSVINTLIPLLDKGDIIIDGGNSNYEDTIRRTKHVEENGLLYVGAGVSGGEEGALKGPSIMPGGSKAAWPHVKDILQSIAAKTKDGEVCCDWVGSNGAGHFVKMVHNGIEYGDIQLISETYHIMREGLGMTPDEMSEVFGEWNKGELDSYLIEITTEILKKKDEDGLPLVDKILDTAGQKGTGKWTAISSLNEGIPLSLIGESVYARFLSAQKAERVEASKVYQRKMTPIKADKKEFLNQLKDALYLAKIISYAQGFALLKEASKAYNWDLNYGSIALMWRGGCIIRSRFLGKIKEAFDKDNQLSNLLLDPYFMDIAKNRIDGYRKILSAGILSGIPMPTLSAGLSYYDGYTSEKLPANLLQAMRDFFGAHTYERVDKPRGEFFHTNWTGEGGTTASRTYNA